MPTSGFIYPTLAVSDATTGTIAWSNPSNVYSEDSVYTSDLIINAPIELGAQLIIGGTPVGDTKAVTLGAADTYVTATYGGSGDLWGLGSVAASSVNASGFGVGYLVRGDAGLSQRLKTSTYNLSIPDETVNGIEVEINRGKAGGPQSVFVDFVRVKIYYGVDEELPDTTPPTVTISYPPSSLTTTSNSLTISGTAVDDITVASVIWENGAASGTCTGTDTWSADLTLNSGLNSLVVKAYDASGNMGSGFANVTYDAGLWGWRSVWHSFLRSFGFKPDNPAPTLTILSSSGNVTTTTVRVSGSSTNASLITINGYAAQGTDSWYGDVNLNVGSNTLVVNAYSPDNQVVSKSLSLYLYATATYSITASGYWNPGADGMFIRPYGPKEYSPWKAKGMYTPKTFTGVARNLGHRYKFGTSSFSDIWGVLPEGPIISVDISTPPPNTVTASGGGECHETDSGWTCHVPPGAVIVITPPDGPSVTITIPPPGEPGVVPPYVPPVPVVVVPPDPPAPPSGDPGPPEVFSWEATGSISIWDVNTLKCFKTAFVPPTYTHQWIKSHDDLITWDAWVSPNVTTTGAYTAYDASTAGGGWSASLWTLTGKTSIYNSTALYDKLAGTATVSYPPASGVAVFRTKTIASAVARATFFDDYSIFTPRLITSTDDPTADWLPRPTTYSYRVYSEANFEYVSTYNYPTGKVEFADFNDLDEANRYLTYLST